eukprot:3505263-Lingulodinium_polyedra.AAC.1
MEAAADLSDSPLPPEKCIHTVYPDLCMVPHSCNALVQRAIYLRQLGNVGIQTWMEVLEDAPDAGSEIADVATAIEQVWEASKAYAGESMQHMHITWWVFTTDQGPDQKAASALIRDDMFRDLFQLRSHMYCFLHIGHLIVKRQLDGMGAYWSKLAKVVNVWRSHG